ncbi:hypothetical protein F5X99DRAFT_410700 [Biscogniauxia marginata]|nr:hypothetical protein F5X99DRAFT_410700 [Biscogniauxia marginata]
MDALQYTRKQKSKGEGLNEEVAAIIGHISKRVRSPEQSCGPLSYLEPTMNNREPARDPGRLLAGGAEDNSGVIAMAAYQQFQGLLHKASLQEIQNACFNSSNVMKILQNAGEDVPFLRRSQTCFISDRFNEGNFHIVLMSNFISEWTGVDTATTRSELSISRKILQAPFSNAEFITLFASASFGGAIQVSPDCQVLWPSYGECLGFLDTYKIPVKSLWNLFQSFGHLMAPFHVPADTLPQHGAELPGARSEQPGHRLDMYPI